MNYPLLSEYEIAIKNGGNSILNLNTYFEFIPHRTLPIKFYNFGSGSFAKVFKIKNQQNKKFLHIVKKDLSFRFIRDF